MKQGHKKPRNQEQSVIVVAKQSLEVKRFATIQKLGRHHVALVCPRREACRYFNCGNKEFTDAETVISCRCGEARNICEGKSSCKDVPNRRKTKRPCFARQRPYTQQCCYKACGNGYGQKNTTSQVEKGMKRAAKLTSSPCSLKRKRSSKFLENNGFIPVHSPWTLEKK